VETPGRILEFAGLDPVAVAGACGVLDLSEVEVRPAPTWMRRLWVGEVAAMTLPGRVFLAPNPPTGVALARLVVHELVHVGQWRRFGRVGFLVRYLGAYLAARLRGASHADSYRSIPQELEAVAVTARLTAELR
jgi:hypothetical protein